MTAHTGAPSAPHDVLREWSTDPFVVLPLVMAAVTWMIGVRRHGAQDSRRAAAIAGWIVLVIALVSPLHAMAQSLFAAHMGQHVLLIGLAAPLLVIARPIGTLIHGLSRWKAAFTRALRRPSVAAALHPDPVFAWAVHALVMWMWHVPALYDRSLESEGWHAVQHIMFLGAAILFWQSVLQGRKSGRGVVSLFATALHATALGALLAFTEVPLYAGHALSTAAWGLTPLEDQQLAGLIMWVPGCLPYAVVGLLLVRDLLREPRQALIGRR